MFNLPMKRIPTCAASGQTEATGAMKRWLLPVAVSTACVSLLALSAACTPVAEEAEGGEAAAAGSHSAADAPRRPELTPVNPSELPEVNAQLVPPPMLPPPIDRDGPAKVVVDLEVIEQVGELADGVQYTFWTFGGTVPGPMIRVRRGDVVEFHLKNHPDNAMPHNIDLHAVTGPGGGATSTFTAPGHETQFTFRALNEGVYIYHCATAPVGMHIANGMYGLIVVEPEEGFAPVDREYYVVQSEFYTEGDFRNPGLQPFDMERAIDEDAAYVVFNGRDGSLAGDGALTANVGETIRLFVGNGGPNLISSFHVIGEIFDNVYAEGGTRVTHDVQTTIIPAGGASIVEFELEVPGTFILVDHAIFRAFNKGALGLLQVAGEPDLVTYSGQEVDEVYLSERSPEGVELREAADELGDSLEAAQRRGQSVYLGTCSTCHQRDGAGLAGVFPPLVESDFLMADKERSIRLVIEGLTGPIEVNGVAFNGVMPPLANLTDHEISDVLTYVRSNFGNEGDAVTDAEVAAVRASIRRPAAVGHP